MISERCGADVKIDKTFQTKYNISNVVKFMLKVVLVGALIVGLLNWLLEQTGRRVIPAWVLVVVAVIVVVLAARYAKPTVKSGRSAQNRKQLGGSREVGAVEPFIEVISGRTNAFVLLTKVLHLSHDKKAVTALMSTCDGWTAACLPTNLTYWWNFYTAIPDKDWLEHTAKKQIYKFFIADVCDALCAFEKSGEYSFGKQQYNVFYPRNVRIFLPLFAALAAASACFEVFWFQLGTKKLFDVAAQLFLFEVCGTLTNLFIVLSVLFGVIVIFLLVPIGWCELNIKDLIKKERRYSGEDTEI
jgi:hypothetical protein